MGFFGKKDSMRTIYLKIKEGTPIYELFLDIVHLIIDGMVTQKVIEKYELSHIKFN